MRELKSEWYKEVNAETEEIFQDIENFWDEIFFENICADRMRVENEISGEVYFIDDIEFQAFVEHESFFVENDKDFSIIFDREKGCISIEVQAEESKKLLKISPFNWEEN